MSAATEYDIDVFPLSQHDGFPNNPELPVLLYRGGFARSSAPSAGDIASTFEKHGWSGAWTGGIFAFHHFHSNAHEVLGCCSGHSQIMLGGPAGQRLELNAGDVVVLPAGTAHKRIESSPDFRVVGAYPHGAHYDLCHGNKDDPPNVCERIAAVPIPESDPVFGQEDGLVFHWKARRS